LTWRKTSSHILFIRKKREKRKVMANLSEEWTDGRLINEEKLDDPNVLKLLEKLFKGTIYDVESEEE